MNGTVTKVKHFKILVTAAGVFQNYCSTMCSTYESHTVSSISGIVNVYFTARFLRANKTLMV